MKSLIAALALTFAANGTAVQQEAKPDVLKDQIKQELEYALQKEDDATEAKVGVDISFFGSRTVEVVYKPSEMPKSGETTFLFVDEDLDMIASWYRNGDDVVLNKVLVPKEKIDDLTLEKITAEIIAEGGANTLDNADKLFYMFGKKDDPYADVTVEMQQMYIDIAANCGYIYENAVIIEDGNIGLPLTKELKAQIEYEDAYFESLGKEIKDKIITPKYKDKK